MKITLDVQDPERLKKALAYSSEHVSSPGDSLQRALSYLLTYGSVENDRTLHLSNDFAPNSFGFYLEEEGRERPLIQGGIICHGQGVETFSVTLSEKPGVFFQIHT